MPEGRRRIMSDSRIRGGALVVLLCAPAPGVAGQKPAAEPFLAAHATEHRQYLEQPFVHGPVRDGRCSACHNPPGSATAMVKPGNALCLSCHPERKADLEKPYVHPPFKDGDCTTCHDPHASPTRYRLTQPLNDLCIMCHDPTSEEQKKKHFSIAVKKAKCSNCHSPHGSVEKAHLFEKQHVPFAAMQCDACHVENPPGGNVKVKDVPGNICLGCHDYLKEFENAKVVHYPFKQRFCLRCHFPHAAHRDYFLVGGTIPDLCRSCHPGKEKDHPVMKHPTGGKAVSPKDKKPLTCVSCHHPHGSPHARLLFGPPDDENFCATCHGK